MRLSILAFTRRGCTLARRVKQALSPAECRMMTMEKFGDCLLYTSDAADD